MSVIRTAIDHDEAERPRTSTGREPGTVLEHRGDIAGTGGRATAIEGAAGVLPVPGLCGPADARVGLPGSADPPEPVWGGGLWQPRVRGAATLRRTISLRNKDGSEEVKNWAALSKIPTIASWPPSVALTHQKCARGVVR